MSAALRAAIVGAGFIGGVHARSARLAGAELVGVAASTPERSGEAANRLGAGRPGTAEELAVADDVDVVHICAPNALHAPLAAAALDAGKHVVCEKPLATDLAGAERLAAVASGTDRVAAVPFVYRFHPTAREARERMHGEASGPVRLLHGHYLQDWLLREADNNWRVDPVAGGASRAFADIGSHWCDLAHFISGHRIARLSARTLTALPERRQSGARAAFSGTADEDAGELGAVTTEDAATMQFETDRGALGTVLVSQISPGRKNRLWIELDAAEGSVAFDQEEPETLWCGARERITILPRDAEALSPPAARYVFLPPGHPQGYADCFDAFVADVYAAIRGEGVADGLPTFADGLRAARITDAVLASAPDGRWVDVPGEGRGVSAVGPRLTDRRAIVTGAGAGIGRAIARRLAAEGARVAVADIDEAAAKSVAGELGPPALPRVVDVRDGDSVTALVAGVVQEWGGLDVLVNNAGVGSAATVERTDPAEWDRILGVTLNGAFNGMRAALPALRASGGGAIVNIASVAGLVGIPERAAYCAAKGGVIALTRAAAVDHVGEGIRINCIAPGTVDTPWIDRITGGDAATREAMRERQPHGRFVTPEEIAAMAAYLASDEAGSAIGAVMVVDGGMTAR